MLKVNIIFAFLLLFHSLGWGFFFLTPEEKAERYLNLALSQYREAIKKNPKDIKLIEKYKRILKAAIGEIPSKVEMAILYRQLGFEIASNHIIIELSISGREKAIGYLKEKIKKEKREREKIPLYEIALLLSPSDGWMWYEYGLLNLKLKNYQKCIESFEKAYELGVNEKNLYYNLAEIYRKKGNYKKAKFYAEKGIEKGDDILFHKILLSIYKDMGKKQLVKEEKEKIRNLIAKRTKKELPKKISKKEYIIPPFTFLAVSKEKQTLYVYKFDGRSFNIIESHPCTTGKNSGNKREEGDGRTPEGTYLLISKIEGEKLPKKYGVAAFPLNYPDIIDKKANRRGDGIWLHGTYIKRPPYHSEGCIVLNNQDLLNITKYIKPKRTFIHISKRLEKISVKDVREIKKFVLEWKNAWESLNLDKYLSFYDEEFYSRGMDKKEWAEYKRRVNKNKKYIRIEISDFQILPYGKTEFGDIWVCFFKQKYESNNFRDTINKILYLVRRKNLWKIIAEQIVI